MNTQKEIPVFFSVDDEYAPFLATALASATKNCSPDRQYKAIVLHQDLSNENKSRLSRLALDNFKIEFVQMQKGLEAITDRLSNRLRFDCFTLTIYFRLFIPTMFPQYDKGIYIDCDVVVLGDLAKMFDTHLQGKLIGACADKSVVDVPPLYEYMENVVGVNRYDYINSGVLLMDLKALREKEFDRHFLNLLNTYHFDSVAPDQDYINAICNGNILYLDDGWNTMPNENKPPVVSPKLIHYNLYSKPWCYDNVQYADIFWQYSKESGYYNDALNYKENYSKENGENALYKLGVLISRSREICQNDTTLRAVAEKGVKIKL